MWRQAMSQKIRVVHHLQFKFCKIFQKQKLKIFKNTSTIYTLYYPEFCVTEWWKDKLWAKKSGLYTFHKLRQKSKIFKYFQTLCNPESRTECSCEDKLWTKKLRLYTFHNLSVVKFYIWTYIETKIEFLKILSHTVQPWVMCHSMFMWRQAMSQKFRVVHLSQVEFCKIFF